MSNFGDITAQIEKDLEKKREEQTTPITVAGKTQIPPVDKDGMPDPVITAIKGTLVSKPGTEYVVLDATTFQLMECTSAAAGREKPRFCIVEKGKQARYGNQFINAAGERVHVITKEVFQLLHGVMNNVSRQIRELNNAKDIAEEKAALQQMTLDALKKNGIID